MISNLFSNGLAVGLRRLCIGAALVVAVSAVSPSARGQGYGTTFDTGYTDGASLSGQSGWDTNDPDKTPTTSGYTGEYVGQSDFVGRVGNYTPGYNPTTGVGGTDYWAFLGGGEHGTTNPYVLPGVTTSYLYHSFSVASATSYAFNVDFSLARNLGPTPPQTAADMVRDSFGWTFLSSASGTTIGGNLFSFNFTPSTTTTDMNMSYSLNGGTAVSTGKAVFLNSIYHLTITVNVAAKTLSATVTPSAGGGAAVTVISNLTLTGAFATNPALVQEIAATWILNPLTTQTQDSNGGYTTAGSNELLFNNYAVTVPEPSTWAMLGLGAVVAVALARRRARA